MTVRHYTEKPCTGGSPDIAPVARDETTNDDTDQGEDGDHVTDDGDNDGSPGEVSQDDSSSGHQVEIANRYLEIYFWRFPIRTFKSLQFQTCKHRIGPLTWPVLWLM